MTDIINEEENTTPLPEEEQETVVVDNGQTYESTESAIIAKEEADRAKLWAQESERQANIATRGAEDAAQAKDDAVAAKEYAEAAVTDANVVAVGTDLRATPSNIKTVANNISDVTTVAGISSDVTTVANNTTNINTVAGVSSNVTTVATNILNVNNVSSISSDVTTVSGISSDVTAVAGNTTNINNVAGNATNINNVANNRTNINTVAGSIANINTNATNINAINTNASNISVIQSANANAQSALNSKNLAQEWAVSENLVDNTDYSAKYYANQSQTSAELSAQYANDKINQTHISNCITEIPQDIKLELNNGTLTLKAGSKVYVPNGADVFDAITIVSDLLGTFTSPSSQRMFFYNVTDRYFQSCPVTDVYSGTTSPTGSGIIYWYDTANNLIKRSSNGGSTWDTTVYSLPFCLCSITNNNLSSIDQVFNGFGYIGSTVFALPGVKGLIPNGRNADGTLKNVELTIDSVKTATRTWVDSASQQVWGYIKNPPAGIAEFWYWNRYIESNEEPSSNDYTVWYKPSENITYINNGAQSSTPNWEKVNYIHFGRASGINSQEIKIFTHKTAFHILDYNNSSTISCWSMPSSRYINLIIGANDTTYIAPANGYFYIECSCTSTSNFNVYIKNQATGIASGCSLPNNYTIGYFYIAAKNGDVCLLHYQSNVRITTFKFIYAKEEN